MEQKTREIEEKYEKEMRKICKNGRKEEPFLCWIISDIYLVLFYHRFCRKEKLVRVCLNAFRFSFYIYAYV
jgi:hypothetical protein